MTSKYKIEIDKKLCIGCGSCNAIAPKTFGMNADMKAEVKKGVQDNDKTILQAAESCPVFAIKLTDEKGKRIFPKE
jgi:ferredoxin